MRQAILGMVAVLAVACGTTGGANGDKAGTDDGDQTLEPVNIPCESSHNPNCSLDGVTCVYCEGVDTKNGNLLTIWIDCDDGMRFGPSTSYDAVNGGHVAHCWPDTDEPTDSD